MKQMLILALLAWPLSGVAQYVYQGQFGSSGTVPGQFNAPRGITVDNGGQIVITESGNHRVQICTDTGTCIAWGSFGVESGQFDRPRGVGVNSEGRIFVADRGNDRIQNCSTTGICTDFGGSGTAVGKFESPRGLAITSDDRIVIADTDNNRIQICTDQGSCSAFGSSGSGLGQFNSPAGVAVNNVGQIVIADRGNDRVQICSENGSCSAFGSLGTSDGQFDSPAGIAVTSNDRIVVADRFNNRIQVCDDSGNCTAFGGPGTGNGQFNLPWGVTVDSQDRIIVADLGNDRIQLFVDSSPPPVSVDFLSADPGTIEQGQSVLLSWAVSNATTCDTLGGTASWQALAIDADGGSASVQIDEAGVYLFTVECTDGQNTDSKGVTVTVEAGMPAFEINAGLNDAWVTDQAPFQGLFFTVFEQLELVFVSWFTFDSSPPGGPDTAVFGAFDQRWVTALGGYTGNTVTLSVELTSGGIFN
ncbi:MAG: hypothetical protein HKN15_04485, partial [Xanthomonadales bacterium]|nr:hypothetical protein [Xanthomonadales bacterium]